MSESTEDRPTHKLDPAKVAVGDYMALINWVKVKSGAGTHHLVVTDIDGGGDITIRGEKLIVDAFSADQFAEERKVSKTAAAEILVTSFNRPISVAFTKADGTERTMRCRLIQPEPLLGRSMVEDLEVVVGGNRVRLVDHRTILWIVVDGTKYLVK